MNLEVIQMSNVDNNRSEAKRIYIYGINNGVPNKLREAAVLFSNIAEITEDPSDYKRASYAFAAYGDVVNAEKNYSYYLGLSKVIKPSSLSNYIIFNDIIGNTKKYGEIIDSNIKYKDTGNPNNTSTLFIGMPKSAGSSLAATAAKALSLKRWAYGLDDKRAPGYASSRLDAEIAKRLCNRKLLIQTHAMPWKENIEILKKYHNNKFIVHIRDPRDAVISYFHMAEKEQVVRMRFSHMDKNYNKMKRIERLNRVVNIIYPRYIEFITGWVAAADMASSNALVTSFEQFVLSPQKVSSDVAEFLSQKKLEMNSSIENIHYRKGKILGGAEYFSKEVQNTLYRQIPSEISRRFGWLPHYE